MNAAVVLVGIATAIAFEAVASPKNTARENETSGRPLRAVALLASILLLASSMLAVATATSLALAFLGAALVVGGGLLRAASMCNLGAHFRTEAGASTLITTGIHSVMRHPSELGFLLWLVGLWGASPSTASTVLALCQLPLLGIRLRIEESALARRFGAAWLAYASTTPPFGVFELVLAPLRHRS